MERSNMTMPISLDRSGLTSEKKRGRQQPTQWSTQWQWPWAPVDPALQVLLDRRDDRLLRDVGMTRHGALGEAGYFWSEMARLRDLWKL
jgi:hypothetical protein